MHSKFVNERNSDALYKIYSLRPDDKPFSSIAADSSQVLA